MQITSVFNRLSDLVKPNRGEPTESAPAKPPAPAGAAPPASRASVDAMRDILAQYDVTEITPRAFSEMLQKLRQAGALPESDFKELSLLRLDLDREGAGPDETLNLLDLCTRKLKSCQRELKELQDRTGTAGNSSDVEASLRHRLDWLQKFAAVHQQPNSFGLEALA